MQLLADDVTDNLGLTLEKNTPFVDRPIRRRTRARNRERERLVG